MKHTREIKVAILAIVCGILLYIGFNFLKGVNIFSSTHTYIGKFSHIDGLTEQAPVFIKGYRIGQVQTISYDFTNDKPFDVQISIRKDIKLTSGTQMVLIADGLMGGKAIELQLPYPYDATQPVSTDTLPTAIQTGLVESLQMGLIAHIDSLVMGVDTLVNNLNTQLAGQHIQHTLANVDQLSSELNNTAKDLRHITHQQLPDMLDSASIAISQANGVLTDINKADIQNTFHRIDTTVSQVNTLLHSKNGTLGMLLYDKGLYHHLDATIISLDSLVNDLQTNPKKYVHFSLFGSKQNKASAK